MKKLLTTLLAGAMIATVPFSAMADGVTSDSSTSIDISAVYTPGVAAEEVVSVDVAWGAMEFEYVGATEGTWNPATHDYDGATEAYWKDPVSNDITVTNHSNVGIKATLTYTEAVDTVEGTFTNGGVIVLDSAVGTARENAPSGSENLVLSGSMTESAKVGTVTVSITKNS